MNEQILSFLRQNGLFLAFLLALAMGFILLRTRSSPVASVEEFESLISTGRPVVVEVYSNT